LDYVAAAENAATPIPESSGSEGVCLHEIKDLYGDTTTSDYQSTNLKSIKVAANEELTFFHGLCSCPDVKEDMDVLAWFERVKDKVPKIHRMATYVFSIPPTQIQNDHDFSLAGVFGQAQRASTSVEKLSNLLFINQNVDDLLHQESIELFDGNLNI
jgi:hAT family C-terminal dimerisation region